MYLLSAAGRAATMEKLLHFSVTRQQAHRR